MLDTVSYVDVFIDKLHNCIYHFYCILNCQPQICIKVFLILAWAEESACNVGDLGLISGLGRSPRGGHGNPNSSILAWRISIDRRAWPDTIHRVTKGRT